MWSTFFIFFIFHQTPLNFVEKTFFRNGIISAGSTGSAAQRKTKKLMAIPGRVGCTHVCFISAQGLPDIHNLGLQVRTRGGKESEHTVHGTAVVRFLPSEALHGESFMKISPKNTKYKIQKYQIPTMREENHSERVAHHMSSAPIPRRPRKKHRSATCQVKIVVYLRVPEVLHVSRSWSARGISRRTRAAKP